MAPKSKRLAVAADIFERDLDGVIRKIPLSQIDPTEDQPRQEQGANIQALADSLQKEGLLQPIVVTKTGNRYSIIAGERRFRAATMAGWTEIECRILNKDLREKFKLAVIENIQREDLNPYDEAVAYKRLKDEFSYTDAELSSIIGKSRNYISEILSINEIPEEILSEAAKEGINSSNLLIQLARAHKSNMSDEFLAKWKEGGISNVKTAREFVKTGKKETPATGKERIFGETTRNSIRWTPAVSVQAKWNNEQELGIQIQATNIVEAQFTLSELEGSLTRVVKDAILRLSSEKQP